MSVDSTQIKEVILNRLKNYLTEEAPTNCMGSSSSAAGSGPIATFDPMLFVKLARRKQKLQKSSKV